MTDDSKKFGKGYFLHAEKMPATFIKEATINATTPSYEVGSAR